MKIFSDYLNEKQGQNMSENDNILIIVDVQKEFKKFIPNGFEAKLNNYCKEFSTVFQIWDSNKAKQPSYTFPNQKGCYVKKYGITFSKDLEQLTKDLAQKYPNAKEGDKFKFKDTNAVLIRVKNNHKWFYINEEMVKFFKSLKGKNVIVVGGADSECLKDIYEGLESFGVKPTYNHEYIYSASTNNQQQVYDPKNV